MATFFKPPRFLIRDRAVPRPQSTAPITVTCYRCAKPSNHSPFAETATCPQCAGRLCIGDVHITEGHWGTSIQTTGNILIDEHAQVSANLIICSGDLTIAGKAHAMCICGNNAIITNTADVQGGIRTAHLDLHQGATIRGCLIETQSHALGIIDVETAMRSAPGKGQAAQIELKPLTAPISSNQDIAARIYPGKEGPRQAQLRVVS